MKLALIAPYDDITALGLRVLSSVAKKAGHDVILIFLPDPDKRAIETENFTYKASIKEQLISILKEESVQLAGISMWTCHFERSSDLCKEIQNRLNVPVVMGGVHASVCPEECIQYSDIVCIGEGEDAFLELISKLEQNEDISAIENLWIKKDGQVHKNNPRPLIQEMNSIPFPDYDIADHYILTEGRIERMTEGMLKQAFNEVRNINDSTTTYTYQTIISRGCPHNCTYCCNNALHNMYKGQKYLRKRSAENVIEELEKITEKYPFIDSIIFADDSFLALNIEDINEFCLLYKEKINIPFRCLSSPANISEAKLNVLTEAGLVAVQMGIQTGNQRIQSSYNRSYTRKQILNAATTLNSFKDKIQPPIYDFIIDNPYETLDEKIDTLELMAELPRPCYIQPFSLIFFPGTQLYDDALKDGLIKDEKRTIYRKGFENRQHTYINILFLLFGKGFSPKVMKLISPKWFIKLMHGPIMSILVKGLFVLKKKL